MGLQSECVEAGVPPTRGQGSPVGPGGGWEEAERAWIWLLFSSFGKGRREGLAGKGCVWWSRVDATVSGPRLHGSPGSPGQQGPGVRGTEVISKMGGIPGILGVECV